MLLLHAKFAFGFPGKIQFHFITLCLRNKAAKTFRSVEIYDLFERISCKLKDENYLKSSSLLHLMTCNALARLMYRERVENLLKIYRVYDLC